MERKKMMRVAKVINKLLMVAQVFLIVAGAILLLLCIGIAIYGDKIAAFSGFCSGTISFGDLRLAVAPDTAMRNLAQMADSFLVTFVLAMILAVITWFEIRCIRRILEPIQSGAPFLSGISANLKKLAVFVLIGGVFEQILLKIDSIMVVRNYDLSQLFNTQVVSDYTFQPSIRLNFVVVAAVILLLAYVFRCGEELQRESDETL